jgi:hypothetical protein
MSIPLPSSLALLSFTLTSYLLANRPTYLLSGEFHYFRVPKAGWRRRLSTVLTLNVWITLWEKSGQACLFLINL